MELDFPQEMIDAFREIKKMQNAQIRQATTMLTGFKATHEKDINYMDAFIDPLYDFLDPGSDTEDLIREYYEYIKTFDLKRGERRIENLEEGLGYKTKIVFAAALMAEDLWQDNKEYFKVKILPDALKGLDWKEKVIGFLYHLKGFTEESLLLRLGEYVNKVDNTPEEEWWQDWMEDEMPFPAPVTHPITDKERKEVIEGIEALREIKRTDFSNIECLIGRPQAIRIILNENRERLKDLKISAFSEENLHQIAKLDKVQEQLYEMLQQSLEGNL